jgi:senataxin
MNVGLTRAKSSLWVLGNSQSLMRGQFWKKLVEDAQRRDRFTSGNVYNMLDKHSDAYMAKPGMFDQAVPVPKELETAVAKNRAANSDQSKAPAIKQEAMASVRIKQEDAERDAVHLDHNAQIKLESNRDGNLKRTHDSDGDIGMSDADDGSDTLNGSTASASHSATPEPMEGVQRQQQRQKKKKPRQAPNPLVSRPPKKPRN